MEKSNQVQQDSNLYVKKDGEWSKPIFGNGGNHLISNEKKYGISKDDLGQYSPILGNLRPYAGAPRPVLDEDDYLPEGEFKRF